jgi:hypothetical protein
MFCSLSYIFQGINPGLFMTISQENFIAELTRCIAELAVLRAELKCIEKDSPATHHRLLNINDRCVDAGKLLQDITEFIAHEKPDVAVVKDKLKKAFQLLTEILREKIRILENTPLAFQDTNDMTHLH